VIDSIEVLIRQGSRYQSITLVIAPKYAYHLNIFFVIELGGSAEIRRSPHAYPGCISGIIDPGID
jgi:hypothetical protein